MWPPSCIKRIVMVGACYVDTILTVPHYPQEDHKLRASSLERRRGGNVANSLEVLQQLLVVEDALPIELVLLCVLPAKNSPGTKLVEDSLGPNVDMSYCIHRETHQEPASSYIIKANESGSRTIINYNKLPEMTLEEFKQQVAAMGDVSNTWFHFEGREVATSLGCMHWVKQEYSDVMLSVEIEKPERPSLHTLAHEADVVFYSKAWAEAEGYHSAVDLLRDQARSLVASTFGFCTWGAEGAAACVPSTGFLYHHQPDTDPLCSVVDTIGAGDTFVAGILYGLLMSSWPRSDLATDPRERAENGVIFASELATSKVFQIGFNNLVEKYNA